MCILHSKVGFLVVILSDELSVPFYGHSHIISPDFLCWPWARGDNFSRGSMTLTLYYMYFQFQRFFYDFCSNQTKNLSNVIAAVCIREPKLIGAPVSGDISGSTSSTKCSNAYFRELVRFVGDDFDLDGCINYHFWKRFSCSLVACFFPP